LLAYNPQGCNKILQNEPILLIMHTYNSLYKYTIRQSGIDLILNPLLLGRGVRGEATKIQPPTPLCQAKSNKKVPLIERVAFDGSQKTGEGILATIFKSLHLGGGSR
jgi:hypothetical protein